MRRHNNSTCRRRAMASVFFLGASMLITIIAVSTVMVVRIERMTARRADDLMEAQFCAQAAIEYGFTVINSDRDWRNTRSTGYWANQEALGNGTYSLEVSVYGRVDTTINADDDILLKATGEVGDAIYKMEVVLATEPGGVAPMPGSWQRSAN